MKKFSALLLTVILIMGLMVPAMASGYNDYYNDNYNGYGDYNDYRNYDGYENGYTGITPITTTLKSTVLGYVSEITKDYDYYEIEITGEDGNVKAVVLVPATNAIILDAKTGYPASLEDHNGRKVHVIYNPHTEVAFVVAINVENMNAPNLHKIEAIERYGNSLLLTVDRGRLIVTLNEYTTLQAWLTRQIVVLDEFQVGDKVLLWYPIVGLSYPAQTTANRALRLAPVKQEAGYQYPSKYENDYPGSYHEGYDYGAHELSGSITRAGVTLYPVRSNAVAAGFTVTWNAEYLRAELTSGDKFVTLAPMDAVFYINGVQHTMVAPSLLENGRLYAPASFFDNL